MTYYGGKDLANPDIGVLARDGQAGRDGEQGGERQPFDEGCRRHPHRCAWPAACIWAMRS